MSRKAPPPPPSSAAPISQVFNYEILNNITYFLKEYFCIISHDFFYQFEGCRGDCS